MKPFLAVFGGVTLLVGMVVVAPSAAPAARPDPSGPVAALQRDLHLSAAQAQARPTADRAAEATALALKARLGPSYGGAWLDGQGRLRVATVDPARSAV